MMEEEKPYSWIDRKSSIFSLCGLIVGLAALVIGIIGLALASGKLGGLILVGNMIVIILIFVFIAISLLGVVLFAIGLARKPLINSLKMKEDELENRARQYDELAEHVKLPKAVNKAITVEVTSKWGISHPHNDIIMYKKDDKFPYLKFYMRVINRTLYYFEPEEVVIGCSIGNHDIGTKKWSIKVRPQGTDIELDSLHEVNDGGIWVRFPIKELYDDLRKWKLDGTVIYKSKESVIEANKQYTRPEIGIHLEYVLPEEQIMKLKKEVEKALGDER